MTENPRQDKELPENAGEIASNEDLNIQMPEEKMQEGIQAVKSIIREKQAPQSGLEEDDTLGALKGPKMSGHKLAKFMKYKRGKGKTSEKSESDASLDKKREDEVLANQENLPSEESTQPDENIVKSSKSLLQAKLSSMSNKSFTREDEDVRMDSSKSPEKKKNLNEEIRILTSKDVEQPKDGNLNVPAIPPQAEDGSRVKSTASQRSVHSNQVHHERGNYMNNVAPAYIEEYPAKDNVNDNRTGKK